MAIKQSREKRESVKAEIDAWRLERKFKSKPDLIRHQRARVAKAAKIVAYDLETTRIAEGTPRPLYITAHGDNFSYASPIDSMSMLHHILTNYFLVPEFEGTKFVAWNGNRFDAYFVACALVTDERFRLRPYLTRTKALRGLRVTLAEDGDSRTGRSWEFLDGIAMLGLVGVSLEKLLTTFAPDHPKQVGVIDFERETFDSKNPAHCAYAMQDSVGLYHAMTRAQRIMLDTFGEPLAVTMGGVCVKIFSSHIPSDAVIEALPADGERAVIDYAMRGGYCYCVQRYEGPVWKYDINQAYAAAMRDAALPCGGAMYAKRSPPLDRPFIARISAKNPGGRIPFYYRTMIDGRLRSRFDAREILDTWVVACEYLQLLSEGWQIECRECWYWSGSFNMRDYVDRLERLRTTCDGGPSGPIGTMVKATGNHSYGKTVEQIEPIEFVLAGSCPDGFAPYYGDGFDPIEHIYYRFDNDRRPKAYHKPQLGAFITAHVRMVLRRAALIDPGAWLYADTDCVVFSRDVTSQLDIDSKRYGAWKVEDAGTVYRIIAKKVYAEVKPGGKRSAKGLNVKRLTDDEFARWYEGDEPVQSQIQIQNFLSVLQGADMYRAQVRKGTRVETLKAA